MFWGKFLEKNFAQFSVEGRDFENFQKSLKNVKIPMKSKIVPKSVQKCFGVIFSKKIYAQCSMEGRDFENFLTNQKILKIQKCPKSFPKVSKHVLNMFWCKLFEKFLPSFPWNVESSKIFKKIKKFAKFQNCPKSFAKVSKSVLNLFWVKFFKIFFCPVFRGGSGFRKFSKKSKNFQNSKNDQNRSQKYPNVF